MARHVPRFPPRDGTLRNTDLSVEESPTNLCQSKKFSPVNISREKSRGRKESGEKEKQRDKEKMRWNLWKLKRVEWKISNFLFSSFFFFLRNGRWSFHRCATNRFDNWILRWRPFFKIARKPSLRSCQPSWFRERHFSRAEALIKFPPFAPSRVVYLNAVSWSRLKSLQASRRIPFSDFPTQTTHVSAPLPPPSSKRLRGRFCSRPRPPFFPRDPRDSAVELKRRYLVNWRYTSARHGETLEFDSVHLFPSVYSRRRDLSFSERSERKAIEPRRVWLFSEFIALRGNPRLCVCVCVCMSFD